MAAAKSSRLRGLVAAAEQNVEKGEKIPRAKFSVSLSREEVERDFLAVAGIRPPRRPKKRPRIVQKQLDVRVNIYFFNIFCNSISQFLDQITNILLL